jgi:hypothetical protein
MDWREQSYPLWMQPADIFETRSLSTLVLHHKLYDTLAAMAAALGKNADEIRLWSGRAKVVADAINRYLWIPESGYYSSFLYPKVMGGLATDKSDNLGEILAVLFGVAGRDKAAGLVASIPVVHFGVPCIYPQQPHANPYHNKAIWPFVEAYYACAGASVGNEAAVDLALRSMVRASAMFLTHKENFSYDKGHANDTAINSDRQLWSVAGYLALVQRVLFGMHLDETGIAFSPVVPEIVKGPLTLSNFHYRGMDLEITVTGNGESVSNFLLDGIEQKEARLPASLIGFHRVEIALERKFTNSRINERPIRDIAPMETEVSVKLSTDSVAALSWKDVKNAVSYRVFRDGKLADTVTDTVWSDPVNLADAAAVYAVQAVDSNGIEANLSAYALAIPPAARLQLEAEEAQGDVSNIQNKYKGFSGTGYYKTLNQTNDILSFHVDLPSDGKWWIRFRYANGNGPINTDNKCAVRSVLFDGNMTGTVVMPQRGKWTDWGFSSFLFVDAKKGTHTLDLVYRDWDENMNRKVNYAFVDYLELVRCR